MAVSVYQFGDFKLDCDRFELYRADRSLKLERKPMELLVLLMEKKGNLVTRTEIAERLWDREVFVDTEHGINTAIRKIREVLNDDPVHSRFIQTVTGKGYRFLGSIVEVPAQAASLTEAQSQQSSSTNRNRRIGDTNPSHTKSSALAVDDLPPNTEEPPREQAESTNDEEPPPPRLIWIAASAGLALLLIAIGLGARSLRDHFLLHTPAPRITSVAVLPLDNLSGDPGQNYFADGMTDELTTMLAKNSTLRVVSRTSAMQYKGVRRPLRDIARELNVDGVLEGSISRSGDNVHMTIQLIQAPTDTHLWAESYDRNVNDVVTLPKEAAQTIAKKLNSAVPQPAPQRYVSPEAHDNYLRGRFLWFEGNNDEAGTYFRKATELQPDYAPGWAGLSAYYGQGSFNEFDPRDALPKQEEAARKAVQLDDSLPWAHLALGSAIFLDRWEWSEATQEIERAIELDPSFAEAYHFHSKMLTALGRYDEAIESEKKAMELDPFQRTFALAYAYFSSRRYDAAIRDARQRIETRPDDLGLHWVLWESYRRSGQEKAAQQELEKVLSLMGLKSAEAAIQRAYRQGGTEAVLRWRLNDLKSQAAKKYKSPVELATVAAQLRRRDETLSLLEEGYQQHAPDILWIRNDPAFDFLHSDERYQSIIKKIGFPPTT